MNSIKKLRKKLGISQVELAEKLNVTQSAITKWETGVCKPSLDKTFLLIKIFDCGFDDLFERDSA